MRVDQVGERLRAGRLVDMPVVHVRELAERSIMASLRHAGKPEIGAVLKHIGKEPVRSSQAHPMRLT